MDNTRPDLVNCRIAQAREAETLAKMSRDLIERGHGWKWDARQIARCIRASDTVVLCADLRTTGRLAGFAIMEFRDQQAHLNLLAVAPDCRRQGIARTLMGWLEKTAMVAGIAEITLEVRAQNGSGRRFYSSLGYKEFEQIPRYYSGREAALRLRKQLRESFSAT